MGQPVYDSNPLRPNPNPQKPVLCSRVESNIDTPRFKGEIFGHEIGESRDDNGSSEVLAMEIGGGSTMGFGYGGLGDRWWMFWL